MIELITYILIGIGLAMDAFAVSISSGIALKCFRFRHAFGIAFLFGFFQAIMPIIGWSAGLGFRHYIESFDHWIAFALLVGIGGKMIYEALILPDSQKSCNPHNLLLMVGLAIATSIDALAVGISFSLIQVEIILPVVIIGLVTFVLSFIGVYIGDRIGSRLGSKIDILGGIILILIGCKIVLEAYINIG